MTILYLYAELMGYQIPVFKEYVSGYDAEVHVVHWDHKKLTPYIPPILDKVTYYERSLLDYPKLNELVNTIKPDIVYVSGWMDPLYLKVCRKLKKENIPIVAGCDTQWRGDLKQFIGSIYFKFAIKKNFTHIWVAGPYQFEYARKLGFKKEEIIFNCLSADTEVFSLDERLEINHNFLYVGRFEEVKGLKNLIKAWSEISDKKDWTLTLVGNGSLKKLLEKNPSIIIKDFMQPKLLIQEYKRAGCFILPSLREPWALVIHEAVASRLPIIASQACGAAPVFITSNYNGFISKSNDYKSLKLKMENIISMNEEELLNFSNNSYHKSKIISPKIVAASFISSSEIN